MAEHHRGLMHLLSNLELIKSLKFQVQPYLELCAHRFYLLQYCWVSSWYVIQIKIGKFLIFCMYAQVLLGFRMDEYHAFSKIVQHALCEELSE